RRPPSSTCRWPRSWPCRDIPGGRSRCPRSRDGRRSAKPERIMSTPRKDKTSTIERLDPKRVRIGAQPIIWSNDDFFELGDDTSLDQCLGEMKAAGYAGTELGHKFPSDAGALKEVLASHGLALISGWHSTYLASKDFEAEKNDFLRHLDLLSALGCGVVIAAECTGRTYNDADKPMG